MADVRLLSITKRFGPVNVINSLSLNVADGELVALLGPSGCGKTTTLRCIGGFVPLDGGDIFFGPRKVTHLEPEHRNIGMVFQNYALFPHMTVFDNVAFGLRMRRISPAEIRRSVGAILERVQLPGLEHRYPRQLSGGQQQRVALARALVCAPSVLLLDEPLANLDAKLREEMRFYIRSLQKDIGITTIYVTHDQAEAMVIADRIAVIFEGSAQQFGTPKDIYQFPANRQVADFIGLTNFIPGRIVEVHDGVGVVTTAVGQFRFIDRPSMVHEGDVLIAIRPESLHRGPPADRSDGENAVTGTVIAETFLGNLYDYRIQLANNQAIRVQGSRSQQIPFRVGDSVRLFVALEDTWVIPH